MIQEINTLEDFTFFKIKTIVFILICLVFLFLLVYRFFTSSVFYPKEVNYYLIKYTLKNQVDILEIKAKSYETKNHLKNAGFLTNSYNTVYKIISIDNTELLINEKNIFDITPVYKE